MEKINACSFDKAVKNLAVLTPDNKLRVYDIDLKRLKVECSQKDSFATRYNCLTWIGDSEIAVGCKNGDIVIFNIKTAEISHHLKSTGIASITTLWWCETQNQLVSSSLGGMVTAWDIKSEKITSQIRSAKDTSALAVTSDDSLLITGSFSIRVFSTKTGAPVNKFAGRHSASIVRLVPAKSPSGKPCKAVLSCSATERHMYLWISDLKNGRPGSNLSEPLQCFVADASIVAADVMVVDDADVTDNDDSKKTYVVLAVTSSGNVNLWKWKYNHRHKSAAPALSAKHGPEKPHVLISSENEHALPIFNAAFFPGSNGLTILTARGAATLIPRFDKTVISFEKQLSQTSQGDAAASSKIVYKLPSDVAVTSSTVSDPNTPSQKKKRKGEPEVNVLAPHEAGAIELSKGAAAAEDGEINGTNGKRYEMTLAERVASEDTISGAIRANSMHSVLMQAIRTNDQTLLDTVLYSRSASEQSMSVLNNTIRNLPPQYVVPLLNLLVNKFQSAPAHGLILVQWVKVILTEHLSYLMTIPNVVSSLSGLYLMINSRIETHKTLLKLSGRLDLVLAQVAKAQSGSDAAPPLNIIEEDEEDGDPKFLSLEDEEDDEEEEEEDEDMEQVTGENAHLDDDDDEDEDEEEEDEEDEDEDMDEDEE